MISWVLPGRYLMLAAVARKSATDCPEIRVTSYHGPGAISRFKLYVPPPVDELMPCLDAFEKFIHQSTPEIPPLIKAGLIHLQFESIHPFLDGNGRLGRLLITLFLCHEGVLKQPLLYLSLYFKRSPHISARLNIFEITSRQRLAS